MENIIRYLIIAMVSMLTLYLLNKYASFKPINENGRTILVMPKIYMFFGYFGTLLFIAIIIGWLVTEGYDSSMIPYLIFYPFMIGGGVFTILIYHRHHAAFDQDIITSTNVYGKASEIKWEEISKISYNQFSSMITN